MKSIITNCKGCYVCGSYYGLNTHHVIFGTGKRKLADKDGLTVPLCYYHHKSKVGVHGGNRILDLKLKRLAERKWIEYYNKTEDDFIKRYGKSYFWERNK